MGGFCRLKNVYEDNGAVLLSCSRCSPATENLLKDACMRLSGPPLPLDLCFHGGQAKSKSQKLREHLQKTPQEACAQATATAATATFLAEALRRDPVAIPGRQPTSRKGPNAHPHPPPTPAPWTDRLCKTRSRLNLNHTKAVYLVLRF